MTEHEWARFLYWERHKHHHDRIESITLAVSINGITSIGARTMSATLNDLQSIALTIEADDAVGSAVPLPAGAAVRFTVDDTTVLALTAGADGVSASGKGLKAGVANVSAVLTFTPAGSTTPVSFSSMAVAINVIASTIVSIKVITGAVA